MAALKLDRSLIQSAKESLVRPRTVQQLMILLSVAEDVVLAVVDHLGLVQSDNGSYVITAEPIDSDKNNRKLRAQVHDVSKKYGDALTKIEELESALNVAVGINDFEVDRLVLDTNHEKHEIVPIVLFSDWHVGEVVNPKTINNLNEYSPAIAEFRAGKLWQNLHKLINKERAVAKIDKVVVWLGGDFISGYIHEELMESNAMSPSQEIMFAENLICSGLDMLLAKGDLQTLQVVCSYGNHSRSNHGKSKIATGAYNSFEFIMYHSIAKRYQGNPRINFHISEGYLSYATVLGKNVRFMHGDLGLKFQGGIGGISIPLNKYVGRMNASIKADMTCLGHFHTLKYDTDWCVNGSMIGAGAYSLSMGFAPERPQQMFRLVDSKYGFTGSFPILCE